MSREQIAWEMRAFNELSPDQLIEILALRQAVFIVEQNCPYHDIDEHDRHCYHLLGWQHKQLAAYLRVVPPGRTFSELSLGRIVTAGFARGSGIGKQLVSKGLEEAFKVFGEQPIHISAQTYLLDFYRSFGFEVVSEPYDEDGIPHVKMLRAINH